jgi:hypothetical protein
MHFYAAVRWEPPPNLAQDLIVPPLAGLMPLALASNCSWLWFSA